MVFARLLSTSRVSWGLVTILGLQLKNDDEKDLERAVVFAKQINTNLLNKQLEMFRNKFGIPGLCFMVAANGQTYHTSIGHSDVENGVRCDNAAMRIASISKPLTGVAILQLWEKGRIDIEKPIQEYVKSFPLKEYDGAPVTITTRQLLCHTGGIRSYNKLLKKPMSNTAIGKYVESYIKDHYENVTESLRLFKDDDLIAKPGE